MPEVVYPTDGEDGKPRTWDKVFPIWGYDEPNEWAIINSILEGIAMHNRFGKGTREEFKQTLIDSANRMQTETLEKSLKALGEKKGAKTKTLGGATVKTPDEELMKARLDQFASYGMYRWYVDQVFANLGGAYREYKK